MIEFGREYYNNDMYFFLKKRKDSIDVYYSVGNTITEARTMDEIVKIPLINETKLKLVIEKLTKSKKKFSKKDIKRIFEPIVREVGYNEFVDKVILPYSENEVLDPFVTKFISLYS